MITRNAPGNALLYILLVVILLTGAVLFLGVLLSGIMGARANSVAFDAPGSIECSFERPGAHVIFLEYFRSDDSQLEQRPEGIAELLVEANPLGDSPPIDIKRSEAGEAYAIRRRLREPLFEFTVITPGQWQFEATYPETAPGPQVHLLISRTYAGQVNATLIRGLAVLAITAILTTIVSMRLRRASAHQQPAEENA